MLEVPAASIEMRAAALLMSGQEGGDLELVARSFAVPGTSALAVVEIDGVGILEGARGVEESGEAPVLEVFVYIVGPSFDVLDAVALRLDRPSDYESQLLEAGVRVLAPLLLEPSPEEADSREIRVLARVGSSLGLRTLTLPAGNGSEAASELQLDHSGRWLVTWSTTRPADHPDHGLPFDPVSAQPSAFVAPPELTESGIDTGALPWPALLRRHGADVLSGVLPQRTPETTVQLPEELGDRLEGVLDGYFEAVSLRAGGDIHGAAYFLAQLEVRTLDELGERGLELLLGQEVKAYERLRRQLDDVRPLITLIRLHLDVADEHRREARYRLASFSMGTAIRITDWYAKEAERSRDGDQLRAEASALLTSLAATMQVRGPMSDAVGFYQWALDYRPDDPTALFGLATVASKLGDAEEAANLYERLLELHPEHHEARLRWAVMLQRVGNKRGIAEAARQFQALLDGSPTPETAEPVSGWIGALAAQQLIRIRLDARDLDAASLHLEEALARWPDHGPLRIAAIRLAELRRDRKVTTERLQVFDPAESSESFRPGGRNRFHEAPDPAIRELRARLVALEEERRPELATAVREILGRRVEGGGGSSR